jgi:hypothetical protein
LQSAWKTARETRPFPRLRRRELAILIGVAAVSAVVTLAILVSSGARRGARQGEPAEVPARAQARPAETPVERAGFSLSLSDFLLPERTTQEQTPAFYPFRGRMGKWTNEQVERYWIPPRELAAGVLGRANDKAMEKFFEEIK